MSSRDIYKNVLITTGPTMIFKNYNPFIEPKKVDPAKAEKKIGRNSLCSCGSGLKFKKCCINKKRGQK